MFKFLQNQSRGTLLVLLCFFIVTGAGAWYSSELLYKNRIESLTEELRDYQEEILSSQTELISTQLVGRVVRGRELAKSRIFRRAIANFASTKQERRDQAQEDFENFIQSAGFLAGHLFSVSGKLQATSQGKLDADESQYYNTIQSVTESRTPFFSSLKQRKGEMVSELFVPVYPTDALSDSAAPDHVLVLVVPLQNVLRAFLMSTYQLNYNTKVSLIHMRKEKLAGNIFERVALSYPDTLKLQRVRASLERIIRVKFGKRKDLQRRTEVFSSVSYIPALRWWLAVETDTAQLDAMLHDYKNMQYVGLASGGAVALLLTCSIALFISRRRFVHENAEMREELFPLRKQHDILEQLSNALPLPICLRELDKGTILFANQSFADLCGKPHSVINGLTLKEIFSEREMDSFTHGDSMLSMSDDTYTQGLTLYQGTTPKNYSVTGAKVTLGEDNACSLLLFRDITEELKNNTRNIEMRQQIIDALVRAVESVPFLDGHTALLRRLSVATAETLLLSDADCSTVEAAAILSQVGKTFVPKEIMEKEGKLTPEEIKETQRYVEHTCRIIEDIDFHLPITQTIWQMQENLDGSGYPHGLSGDDVSTPARILGVANTFSALVQKRSYRKAKTASEAIDIMKTMADTRYDGTVIRALEAFVNSPQGQRTLRESNTDL